MSQSYPFYLEKKRIIDDQYQNDLARYNLKIDQSKKLLAVRAPEKLKHIIGTTPVRIVNRDKMEALTVNSTIYFDIGLLDLLSHFSDELSLAEVKHDPYHTMEFNLTYAIALNGNKQLDLISAYNTLQLTEDQQKYLWDNKLIANQVISDQILGFIIAHEISHILLKHDERIANEFPDENSRNNDNPKWNRVRREIELAADSLAAELCLNALIQPAQLLPWLDLNEIRRRYYGKSAEYPTTSQRITVINNTYNKLIDEDKKLGELSEFKPLPPHKDIFQGDYHMFRQEFQKVRTYRQNVLLWIDEAVLSLIQNNTTQDDIADSFMHIVEQQKDLMSGAKNKETIRNLLNLIPNEGRVQADTSKMKLMLQEAGIGDYAYGLLEDLLNKTEIHWDQFKNYLTVLEDPPIQFLDGVSYEYFMANSALRWYPAYFKALQERLPENELKARSLQPYQLGKPIRNPYPTFEDRMYVLKTWDGKY